MTGAPRQAGDASSALQGGKIPLGPDGQSSAMRRQKFCETGWTHGRRGGIMAVLRNDQRSARDRAIEQGI